MSKKRMLIGLAVMVVLALLVPAWAQDTQPQQQQQQQQQPKSDQPQQSAQPAQPAQPAQNQEGTLKLTIKYTGAEGPVDQTHKILVFVFDTPDFSSGQVMPIKFDTLAENGGTLTMTFSVNPVYVAGVYDKPGGYDFSGPPASGSPITVYAKDGHGPAPIAIEPGKTTEISMEFDDTAKMP